MSGFGDEYDFSFEPTALGTYRTRSGAVQLLPLIADLKLLTREGSGKSLAYGW